MFKDYRLEKILSILQEMATGRDAIRTSPFIGGMLKAIWVVVKVAR